jgi:hypothetical protein
MIEESPDMDQACWLIISCSSLALSCRCQPLKTAMRFRRICGLATMSVWGSEGLYSLIWMAHWRRSGRYPRSLQAQEGFARCPSQCEDGIHETHSRRLRWLPRSKFLCRRGEAGRRIGWAGSRDGYHFADFVRKWEGCCSARNEIHAVP